ncbi:MAG TPA: hypothetical protein VNF51_00760 [Candidatus Paceibacterota bacterium]|nr:hypothetical protein [Candidatus Paceibacterota bacterium]
MKKVTIVRTTGGELTNQLWNYASIYAYCLERGYALANPSFFEYGNYFTMLAPNFFFKLFFFLPFTNYTKRKQSLRRRVWRKLYAFYARILILQYKDSFLISDNDENKPFYLPPTKEDGELLEIEKTSNTICFDGWLFRNPVGLQKYRKEILDYFKPRQDIEQKVREQIQKFRSEFKHIVGVHIRQGDYRAWRRGTYFIPQTRVREILEEYLKTAGYTPSETYFAVTSDGPIDTSLFTGLHTVVSHENAVHDLFLLSATDTIIGSNSTFGAFASYYGNVPFIVMQKEKMDWEYYTDKKTYFENKYSTFVQY